MNIFGVGLPEIAVIGALALLVFGPKRLPELGKTLGKTLKSLQSASSEFEREIQNAMTDEESNSNKNDISNKEEVVEYAENNSKNSQSKN